MGTTKDKTREGRIGHWSTQWSRDETKSWRINRFEAKAETVTRAREPIFIDITSQTLGQTDSYKKQLAHGADYWRTVLDSAIGFDVYGNNGIAAGDFDNSGFDSLYICQPAGLPNRLYRNRGDGSFEDVTDTAGVGVLDNTACALFADFENKGLQDLLVVSGNGPLLFVNQGNGKFGLNRDAFQVCAAAARHLHPRCRRRLRPRRPPRCLFLPVQLLPRTRSVSLSRTLLRRTQWPAQLSISQPRQRYLRRSD